MEDKHPEPKSVKIQRTRFEEENAVALAEAAEEQRRLRAKRKASGKPDPMFIGDSTGIIICRRT